MQRSTSQGSAWGVGLLIAVPALLGATVSGAVGLATVEQQHRATGVVQLSEIAGNTASGQLNPYAADLDTAMQSAPVRAEVRRVLGAGAPVDSLEVLRLPDASRVSITLEADSPEQAQAALLAAGRAGYATLVDQQLRLLQVRERAALRRLQTLQGQVTASQAAVQAATPATATAAAAALQQNERLLSIAVEDLSQVQGQLAVVDELQSNAATTDAVVVDTVEPVSRLPEVLPIFAAGLVGGAIPGAALAAVLRRRNPSQRRTVVRRGADDSADAPSGAARRPAAAGGPAAEPAPVSAAPVTSAPAGASPSPAAVSPEHAAASSAPGAVRVPATTEASAG